MIGLRCKDGVVLAVEKLILSKLLVEGSNRRIYNVDRHAGVVRLGRERPVHTCTHMCKAALGIVRVAGNSNSCWKQHMTDGNGALYQGQSSIKHAGGGLGRALLGNLGQSCQCFAHKLNAAAASAAAADWLQLSGPSLLTHPADPLPHAVVRRQQQGFHQMGAWWSAVHAMRQQTTRGACVCSSC